MDTLDPVPHVQVFATDIDAQALATLRSGCYPEGIAEHVPPERLERFFGKHENTYQVKKELREMCLFTVHSPSRTHRFRGLTSSPVAIC
jgi:two-component system, chemotaxis family, CheB/CheR fusion protein